MPGDGDLFVLYRWMLAGVCTIYTIVCIGQSLLRWLDFFSTSRQTVLLGRYAGLLLLRVRLRRLAWDLAQIVALLAVLACVVYLHRTLNPST